MLGISFDWGAFENYSIKLCHRIFKNWKRGKDMKFSFQYPIEYIIIKSWTVGEHLKPKIYCVLFLE